MVGLFSLVVIVAAVFLITGIRSIENRRLRRALQLLIAAVGLTVILGFLVWNLR